MADAEVEIPRSLGRVSTYLAIALVGVVTGIFLMKVDAFEHLNGYTRRYENWEFDEILIAVLASMFILLSLTIFRMRGEMKARRLEMSRADNLSHYDQLTGLPNRHFFREELDRRISEARRQDHFLAVIMVDIHGLKSVNDLYGYEAGDRYLQAVTKRIQEKKRLHDVVARLDGDEFAIILTMDREIGDVGRAAKRILANVSRPVAIDGNSAEFTASLGIAVYPMDALDHSKLLQYASSAMHQAKASSNNQIAFFDAEMNAEHCAYADLQRDIRRALREDEFIPFFQPLIGLQDNHLRCFEVLARWNHKDRGLLAPEHFISAAEDMRLIDDIFWTILTQSCELAKSWPDSISIAVNVSSVQFVDLQLGQKILDVLKKTGFPSSRLVLEITESALISDLDAVRKIITYLRDHDVRLSLDDFGTGYSSLQYLQQLPFDSVKIDQSFVGSFSNSHDNLMIVSSIIALSRSLGLKTTAEGVESESDLEVLKTLGCTFAQGYLFSKPVGAGIANRMVEIWTHQECSGAIGIDQQTTSVSEDLAASA